MPQPWNVLFVIVDDLRPELGCYGAAGVRTPNIDRLAAQSVRFSRAYCQVPVCGASRASLFTSLRPTPTRFTDYLTWVQVDAPDAVCLPEHLRQHGYRTLSRGKVLHHTPDKPGCWSEPAWRASCFFPGYRDPELAAAFPEWTERDGRRPRFGPPFEITDVPDGEYADGETTDRALADLARLNEGVEPFFLAVGYLRPHLPFNLPRRYWDLYDPAAPFTPGNPAPPQGVPPEALHSFGELRSYGGVPAQGPVPEDLAQTLRRGYRAGVSFVDAQVGRLLGALDERGLAGKTVVILAADHGFLLGDYGLWCKHCLFERALRVPLLVRVPGLPAGVCEGLVENLDIYPTLCGLLGIAPPGALAGRSLLPLLRDPAGPGKQAVLSRFGAGDSVRTERYRYAQWRRDGQVTARLLFDLLEDPDERRNIVAEPQAGSVLAQLQGLLAAGAAP